jgi:hypothetical protein
MTPDWAIEAFRDMVEGNLGGVRSRLLGPYFAAFFLIGGGGARG